MLYRTVEENLRAAMRCYARVSGAGEARDYPGLAVASSGIDCAVFNSAMLTRPAAEPELRRALALASVHFEQRKLGWTFWLCEDLAGGPLRKEMRSVLRAHGMSPIAEAPGMYADQLQPHKRSAVLDIRNVNDETTRSDFASLSSRIFTLAPAISRAIYGCAPLWTGCMRGWVAYVKGEPVSIATVVIGGGAAGVYSVGTVPSHQGRGYAETLVRYALEDTRRRTGLQTTVLQSTSQGMNLYLRMGYRIVTKFVVYLRDGAGCGE